MDASSDKSNVVITFIDKAGPITHQQSVCQNQSHKKSGVVREIKTNLRN